MTQDGSPPPDVSPEQRTRAVALLGVQLGAVRRLARIIAGVDGGRMSKRPEETAWCCAAVAHGALRGERVTHKDLVGMAEGRLSPATLSRAVQDAVALGMLLQLQEPQNRRVKRLLLTEAGWRALLADADAAYCSAREALRAGQPKVAA
jgi:hypothetical protein